MNKVAYLNGYQKTANQPESINALAQYVLQSKGTDKEKALKVQKALEAYYRDPRIRLAQFAVPTGAALGAILGGLGGHYYSAKDTPSSELKRVLVGSAMGSLGGGFGGSLIKERMKWPLVKDLVKKLTESYTTQENEESLKGALKKALRRITQ